MIYSNHVTYLNTNSRWHPAIVRQSGTKRRCAITGIAINAINKTKLAKENVIFKLDITYFPPLK